MSPISCDICRLCHETGHLGWRIQRRRKEGHQAGKRYIYTYPSKKSLASITGSQPTEQGTACPCVFPEGLVRTVTLYAR